MVTENIIITNSIILFITQVFHRDESGDAIVQFIQGKGLGFILNHDYFACVFLLEHKHHLNGIDYFKENQYQVIYFKCCLTEKPVE